MPAVKRIILDPELRNRRLTADGDYPFHTTYIYNSVNQEKKPEPQARGAFYFDESTKKLYVDTGNPLLGVMAVGFFNEDIFPTNALAISMTFSGAEVLGYSVGKPVRPIIDISATASMTVLLDFNVGETINTGVITSSTVSNTEVTPRLIIRPQDVIFEVVSGMSILGGLVVDTGEIESVSISSSTIESIVKRFSGMLQSDSTSDMLVTSSVRISPTVQSNAVSSTVVLSNIAISSSVAESLTVSGASVNLNTIFKSAVITLPGTSGMTADSRIIIDSNAITSATTSTGFAQHVVRKNTGIITSDSFSSSSVTSRTVRVEIIQQNILGPLGQILGTITTTITETVDSTTAQVANITVSSVNSVTGVVQTGLGQIGVILGNLNTLSETVVGSVVTITNSATNAVTQITMSV